MEKPFLQQCLKIDGFRNCQFSIKIHLFCILLYLTFEEEFKKLRKITCWSLESLSSRSSPSASFEVEGYLFMGKKKVNSNFKKMMS